MPANTSPMPDGEYRPVCECVWRQMHSRLGVDAGVSGSRDGCVWEQSRADALLFSFIISVIP